MLIVKKKKLKRERQLKKIFKIKICMLPPLNQHKLIYTENECMDFISSQDLSRFLTIEGKSLKKEREI